MKTPEDRHKHYQRVRGYRFRTAQEESPITTQVYLNSLMERIKRGRKACA
jgi:hypothetical protein